ncbi:MAG: acetate--CoA ligase family protein [Bacteroidota bacterium]
MNTQLKNFFYAKSICVAGASSKKKSIGYELLNSILTYGYNGKVFPVNPNAKEILGYKCFKYIEEITEKIDLAIVVVPKPFAEETIDALLAKDVKSIILITAGFKETGIEGEKLERGIVEKIKNSGARMIGPNCMGVINTLGGVKLNATFVAEKPAEGSTGFFSQSGALGAAVLNSLRETEIKFAHFISAGNKADVNETDLLHFWQSDANIKTLTFYLESFVNGEEFIKPFIDGEITKPVIILKAGKTESGMKAASSHTGALSSKDKIVDALMKQFGIPRAANINELFNSAKGFENFPIPKGRRVAIVTNAGGPAILAVDMLEKENLALTTLSNETKKLLRVLVHAEGSVENPVDLLPGATAEVYKKVIETIIEDDNVDAVISIFVQPVMVDPFAVAESVCSIISEKPILQVDMPLPEFWEEYRKHSQKNLPLFKNPEDPPEVLSNMLLYSSSQSRLKKNRKQYFDLLNAAKEKQYSFKSGLLSQPEVNQLCNDYNLPVIKNKLIRPDALDNLDRKLDYPLVLKGINHEVVHKSEINAVKLNIKTKEELLAKAQEIEKNFIRFNFVVEEFLIQQYVKPKHEILIGGFRDPSFGPIIMFGTGGKYVEIICDTSVRSAYLCSEDVDDMINETVIGRILQGIRGEESCNIEELKRIIISCAQMIVENKKIVEFDLNPLIVGEDDKYYAVDVRVRWE